MERKNKNKTKIAKTKQNNKKALLPLTRNRLARLELLWGKELLDDRAELRAKVLAIEPPLEKCLLGALHEVPEKERLNEWPTDWLIVD